MAKHERNILTWKTPVWKEIYVGETLPTGIIAALSAAAVIHYPEIASQMADSDWDDAYVDMIRAQRLFHDPNRIKRILTFGQISPLVFKKNPAPLDYFNEVQDRLGIARQTRMKPIPTVYGNSGKWQ